MGRGLTYFAILAVGAGCATCLAFALSLITANQILKITKRKKITRVIDTINEWAHPNVSIEKPEEVEEIVCNFIKGGPSKLIVISDFDQTFIKKTCEERLCNSNHRLKKKRIPKSSQDEGGCSTSDEEPDSEVCLVEWFLARENLGPRGLDKLGELVSKELFHQGAGQLLGSLIGQDIPLYLGAESPAQELLRSTHLLAPNIHLFPPRAQPTDLPPSRPNLLILSSSSKFLVRCIAALPSSVSILSGGFFPEDQVPQHHGFDIVVAGEEPSLAAVNALIQRVAP